MDVEFLEAGAVRVRLAELIDRYKEFHWAVAWGTHTALADQLFAHPAKFRNVTFGVAFSQTDPKIVDALVGVKNAYVATRFAGGTYHPKIYGFRSGNKVAAIVGSANFTRGGLGNNLEAAVAITGTIKDTALADILAFAARSAKRHGLMVTGAFANDYRTSYERAARLQRAPRDPVRLAPAGGDTEFMTMSWATYAAMAQADDHHSLGLRLELIATARRWFANEPSFARFPDPQRKAVAGTIREGEMVEPELAQPWGWFGGMGGMGAFVNRVNANDPYLARALDGIPRTGDVTRGQYERYCDLFRQAFDARARTGGVSTATRLLAMKRPDTFLCVSGPNKTKAAVALGFARTTLNLDNYWERVIEPIRLSTWYNGDKPDGPDGELWEARAAMLDALFYQP